MASSNGLNNGVHAPSISPVRKASMSKEPGLRETILVNKVEERVRSNSNSGSTPKSPTVFVTNERIPIPRLPSINTIASHNFESEEIADAHWERASDPHRSPRGSGSAFTNVLKLTLHNRNVQASISGLSENRVNTLSKVGRQPSKTMRVESPSRKASFGEEFVKPAMRRVKSENFLHSWDFTWKGPRRKENFRISREFSADGTRSPIQNRRVVAVEYVKEIESSNKRLTKNNISMRTLNDQNIIAKIDDGKFNLVSATPEKMVEYLTSEDISEDFLRTFLISYRYFLTPTDLLQLLFQRYDYSPSHETPKNAKKVQKALRNRIMVLIKVWLESHFGDFCFEETAYQNLYKWCKTTLKDKQKSWSKLLRATMNRKRLEEETADLRKLSETIAKQDSAAKTNTKYEIPSFRASDVADYFKNEFEVKGDDVNAVIVKMVHLKYVKFHKSDKEAKKKMQGRISISPSQVLIISVNDHKYKSLLDFLPSEIVHQLCLIEFNLFRAIRLQEVSGTAFAHKTKKATLAPNLLKMIEFSNGISFWVATEIVTTPNLKKRVAVLKHFISIAQTCIKVKNFNAFFEIMAGLNNGAVRRLKETWRSLSSKYLEVFIHLEEMVSSDENFKNYRNVVKSAKTEPPCIPYLGINLKDLVAIEDVTDPTWLSNGHVSFKKMQVVAPLIEDFQSMQEYPYEYEFSATIYSLLVNGRSVIDEKELYLKSKFIEPPIKLMSSSNKGRKWLM